jgi:hypothetical protein
MEFSKRLTISVLIYHFVIIIAVGLTRVFTQIDLKYLLDYTLPLTITTLTAFLGKAAYENGNKIKSWGKNKGI